VHVHYRYEGFNLYKGILCYVVVSIYRGTLMLGGVDGGGLDVEGGFYIQKTSYLNVVKTRRWSTQNRPPPNRAGIPGTSPCIGCYNHYVFIKGDFPMDGYYTTGKAAKLLGVSKRTLSDWAKRRKVPYSRQTPGGYYLFSYADIARIREILKPD
jgi:excisionase family DNA binding protein